MRKIKTGIPTPPGWLTPEMCKIYDTITRYLQAEKLFDSIDWMLVAMTAKSWVMYEDATKDVLNGDVYQVHSMGLNPSALPPKSWTGKRRSWIPTSVV